MSEEQGLSLAEVEESRLRNGLNEIARAKSFTVWGLALRQFSSPLMLVLMVAGAISYFMHGVVDALVVWVAVGLNAMLGFYQEYRAEKALEALEQQVKEEAIVVRGGKRVKIATEELVVGDVVQLAAGDKVPADGVLIAAEVLSVSEAMLTGESAAIVKQAIKNENGEENGSERVYMGTLVLTGLGTMKVRAVGGATKMGEIATQLVSAPRIKTVLQRKMEEFARVLTIVIIVLATGLFAVGWWRGLPLQEIFLVAVAVAVSAIPEGLVVVLTVILVMGMQRLLKRKGLVRKLLAAEALGSVTVVCADKTGTLTKGEMRVVASEGEEPRLAEIAQICNDLADPLELAMMEWGKNLCEVGLEGCQISEWKRTETLPFSAELKYAACKASYKDKQRVIVRGAPEVVLTLCELSKNEKDRWEEKIEELASKGYRLVALAEQVGKKHERAAKQEIEGGKLIWAGLLVMEDPVREDVKEQIAKLLPAGVKFKVVTGDYAGTAKYVMQKLGIEVGEKLITGEKFSKLPVSKQREWAREGVLFARFAPEEKLQLVKILQQEGEVVAMMGDGVNDAPALKTADVGVVVSSASEVSKETADMVLLDDQFGTVTAAIEEGRGIYVRIKRVVAYLLSDSFSEVVVVSVSLLLDLPLPITAAQILWVNLANDTFPALALSMDPVDKGVMQEKPVKRQAQVVDKETKWLIGIVSVVSGLLVLGLFWWYLGHERGVEYARTVAFFFLGINTLVTVFVIRRMDVPLWHLSLRDNYWLLAGVGVGILMQLSAVYLPGLQILFRTVPLMLSELVVVGLGSLIMVILIELFKWGWRKVND